MVCGKCGTEVPGDSAFCPSCGEKLTKKKNGAVKRAILTLLVIIVAVVALLVTYAINFLADPTQEKIRIDKRKGHISFEIEEDTNLEELTRMKRASGIFIYDNANRLENLDYLAELVQIEELHLSSETLSDISGIRNLVKLKNFYYAAWDRGAVTDISVMAGMPELESFDLWCMDLGPEKPRSIDLSPLANCRKLKQINVCGYEGLQNAHVIANLPEVKHLTLFFCGLTDISFLENHKSMDELCLDYNNITDISPLQGGTYGVLELIANPIADAEMFRGITVVDKLDITDCGFTAEEISKIKELVGGNCEVITE